MSASPPSVTTVKHYVPRALLPPVIHTDSVKPMPLEGFRSHHHPLGGYLNPGGINKLLRMHRYDQVQLTHDVQECQFIIVYYIAMNKGTNIGTIQSATVSQKCSSLSIQTTKKT